MAARDEAYTKSYAPLKGRRAARSVSGPLGDNSCDLWFLSGYWGAAATSLKTPRFLQQNRVCIILEFW
jgi:hypothetical protein